MVFMYALMYFAGIFLLYKLLDFIIRIPKLGNYNSKYVLVTGCDTGFGYETAKRLDKLGCNVFAACLTDKGATELNKQCSGRLITIMMNVADSESIQKAYAEVEKHLPKNTGLWGIINNAGIPGRLGPDEWMTLQDYKKTMSINAFGVVDVTMTFLPLIKRRGGGRIVNMSSLAGRIALPGNSGYAMSKYAVEAFSDSLRKQLKVYNISVHLLEPGFYKTPLIAPFEAEYRDSFRRAPIEIQQQYGAQYVDKACKAFEEFKENLASDNLQEVAAAYEHALLGKYPRGRYMLLRYKTKPFFWLMYLLPEWLGDCILESAGGENRAIPICVQNGTYRKRQS